MSLEKINKDISSKISFGVIVVLVVVVAGTTLFLDRLVNPSEPTEEVVAPPTAEITQELKGIEKFASVEEFKEYIEKGAEMLAGYYGLGGVGGFRNVALESWDEGMSMPAPTATKDDVSVGGVTTPDRVSSTNVQVVGIDEPDIVKTDGTQIYFSQENYYHPRWEAMEGVSVDAKMIAPDYLRGETKVITAFPPANLDILSKIDKTGNLLLDDDILIILANDTIYGYDIADPEKPKEEWDIEISRNNYIAGARMYNGSFYLITNTAINQYTPCPIRPLSIGGSQIEITCLDIYHPSINVPVDITYTAFKINPKTGKVEKDVSFVGSSGDSTLYVSPNAIYLTYSYNGSLFNFMYNFFKEKAGDLVPKEVTQRIGKLAGYDISERAKQTEFEIILANWQNSLSDDERLRIENEITNRMEDYYSEHKRELDKTGIVKIDINDLTVKETGTVPGRPLNQFSLDEYEGNLRIATTIGQRWGIFGSFGDSANDVYVLDSDLKIRGEVLDMGLTEQIYSVRFLQDKGYVVTFRKTDPFYVLDLSDPDSPKKTGELKIPGYSSYLHPITKDKILGIGKEGSQIKVSLFDVTDPKNPKEATKYTLNEYWSDILNTHHAFLLDDKHEVFFMPGGKGGYIFSYENDKLKLEKAVSLVNAERAVYLDDYMYIISQEEIIVLDENDWQEVNDLDL